MEFIIIMDRTLVYTITAEDAGIRTWQFLRRKGFSHQNLTDLRKYPEGVTADGQLLRMKDYIKEGQTVIIEIHETESSPNIVPVCLPIDIIYEDEDIIAVNKPAGMPLHPSRGNYLNSLANGLAWYYREQGKPFVFRCSNRLDRDTSGVTVVAKHMVSGNMLGAMVAERLVTREYLAIVKGRLSPPEGTIDAPLSREDGPTIRRFVDPEHGERAVTHYRTLQYASGHTLVSLRLETGRTHQIRVHMKYIGYPLIGDYLYNPDMEYISRQALHSYRMSFNHPITGEPMCFSAPLPEDMKSVLKCRPKKAQDS